MRLYEGENRRDIGKLLDGVFLGMVACILLYSVFGLVLVRMHAGILAAKMELFLRNDMRALIAPNDPYLQSFTRQLCSALFFGIPLGVLTASMAAAVSIIPWARGEWGKPIEILLTLLLIPVYLFLIFSGEAPVLSVLWATLTPIFFWIPWMALQRLRVSKRRNGRKVAFFALLFLLPFASLKTVSPLAVRNLFLGFPMGNLVTNFYYDHTLLAAHVIKPIRHQTQKVVVVSEDIDLAEPLPSGMLLIKHPDPCALKGVSLRLSKTGLTCPSFLLSPAEAEEKGHAILRKASERFDRNRALRRGLRWFFKGGLWVACILLILRFAIFLEDLMGRRKTVALLLLIVGLLVPSRALYNQYLLHVLRADPRTESLAYASSRSATKRYLSVAYRPRDLPEERLTLLSRDPNPRIRHYAFVAMGLAMDPALLPALRKGMSDPDQIVRTKVYQAMGRIGGEKALEWLDQAIGQDPSWYARYYAYEARCEIERIYKIVEPPDTMESALENKAPQGP